MVRSLNPADDHPARIRKAKILFRDELDFKYIKFPWKIRDIPKPKKKNFIGISVFGYQNKEKYPVYVSKKCCEENMFNMLIEEKSKRYYDLTKDLYTFIYD